MSLCKYRNWISTLMLALCVVALPSVALAQQRPKPPRPPVASVDAKKVSVEVMVVHATNAHDRVDPRLRGVMQSLRFLRFKGFDLLETRASHLAAHEEFAVALGGDRKVRIELISRNEKKATLRIRVFKGQKQQIDTTVSVHRNRSFIVAGPKHKDGVIILPVAARY